MGFFLLNYNIKASDVLGLDAVWSQTLCCLYLYLAQRDTGNKKPSALH